MKLTFDLISNLQVSNICLLSSIINFNWAIFHIFAGPLFANLQGYVFLDLLIWGVSPLLFQLIRTPLTIHLTPLLQRNLIIRRRFGWLLLCFLLVAVAYLFMNYSQAFRWNYFSRVVNLDFGYLMFDFACRSMELIVDIEEYQRMGQLGQDPTQYAHHKAGYCRYRNIMTMTSYFLVFYFSTVFDPDNLRSGIQTFNSLSLISFGLTLAVPFIYLLRNKGQYYRGIQPQEISQDLKTKQYNQTKKIDKNTTKSIQNGGELTQLQQIAQQSLKKRQQIVLGLLSFSNFVNLSYFSLWIMQGLRRQNQQAHQLLNKSLFISSIFFLFGSFLQFVCSHVYLLYQTREDHMQESGILSKAIKPFLIAYGLLFLIMFLLSTSMQLHHMVILIIPFAFLNMIVQHKAFALQEIGGIQSYRVFFYAETIAYLIIPILLTVVGLADSALWVFGFLSAVSLLVGGIMA